MKDDLQNNFQEDNFSLVYLQVQQDPNSWLHESSWAHRLFNKKVYFVSNILVYSGNSLFLSMKTSI